MSTFESSEPVQRNPIVEFFLAPLRWRTYSNLLYLWLAFPLGLFYFVALTVGFSLSLGLLIVWIGLVTLLASLLFVWLTAGLERGLATVLLGAHIPSRRLPAVGEVGVWRWLGAMLQSPALYKSILFLALKFPLGLASWILSVVGLSVSCSFIAAPILVWLGVGEVDFGYWWPGGWSDSILLFALGVVLLFVTLNLQNAAAWIFRLLSEWLLGSGEGLPTAPALAPPAIGSGGAAPLPA